MTVCEVAVHECGASSYSDFWTMIAAAHGLPGAGIAAGTWWRLVTRELECSGQGHYPRRLLLRMRVNVGERDVCRAVDRENARLGRRLAFPDADFVPTAEIREDIHSRLATTLVLTAGVNKAKVLEV